MRLLRNIPLFPLLLLTGTAAVSGELREIRFERITTADGLISPSIYCILVDRLGFLWFGTGEGLSRYDGVQFRTVGGKVDGSLGQGQNLIYDCAQSHDGVLWCASPGGGVIRHDPTGDSTTRLTASAHGLSNNNAYAVCEDARRTVWVGTSGGLDTLDPASGLFRHVARPSPDGLLSVDVKITAVREFPRGSGVLWIGTWGEGLMRFDRRCGEWTNWREQPVNLNGPVDGHIRTLFMSPHETTELWIGTEKGGLYRLRTTTGRWERFPLTAAGGPVVSTVKDINEDPQGTLLVSTLGSGFFFVDAVTGKSTQCSFKPGDPGSLSHNDVRTSFVDPGGILWVGTRDGINKVDPIQGFFTVYREGRSPTGGLTHGMVYGLCEDHHGSIWICTDGGGLNQFDRHAGRWIIYRHDSHKPGSLVTDRMFSVFEDHSGVIWAGGWGGWFHRLHPSTGTFDRWQAGLEPFDSESMYVFCIYQDRAGALWLGTTQGLVRFDPARGTMTPVGWDGLPPDRSRTSYVLSILEDRYGDLWIATRSGGLHRIDRATGVINSFAHVSGDTTTLSLTSASALLEDTEGTLWVGTVGGGVNRYDRVNNRFISFAKREGLSNDVVYGLLEDNHGRIWISTGHGLSAFEPRTGRWSRFDVRDGLPADEFNTGSAMRCRDGTLCFGGISGLTMFCPDTIRVNTHAPPVVLTTLDQDGKPLVTGRGTPYAETITFPSSHDVLGIGLAVLDYRRPDRNMYAYQLEGIDRDWVQAGSRSYIAYSHLPPGTYVFRARGSNDSGIWSHTDLSITVVVEPHYWQTWWFRILAGGLGVGAMAGVLLAIYRRKIADLGKERLRQEQFTRLQIESQEAGRKRLAAELHDGLGQDLLVANNELQQFMQDENGSREDLKRAAALVQESIQSVREIASNLHPHHLDRLGLCAAVEAMTETIAHSSGLSIHCICDHVDGLLRKDTEIHVYRIIQEALSNVVRHASATEVTLRLNKDSRHVQIVLTDNGRGFTVPALPSSLLDEQGAHGFGLSSMNERAKIIGGALTITSTLGSGTAVTLTIPQV